MNVLMLYISKIYYFWKFVLYCSYAIKGQDFFRSKLGKSGIQKLKLVFTEEENKVEFKKYILIYFRVSNGEK